MNPRLARQLTQSLVAFSSFQGKLEFEIRSILFFDLHHFFLHILGLSDFKSTSVCGPIFGGNHMFLTHVAQEFSDFFIVMLVDRAGWHTAQWLIVPENIRLTFQPARSPELNPTEPIWEELREKTLPNQSFPSLDTLENTLCAGLTQLAADPNRVRSLTDFPYMRVTF